MIQQGQLKDEVGTSGLSIQPISIGVAGGTGSGKTTVVEEINRILDSDDVAVIKHDYYYMDRGHIPPDERENINYDHPDALDTSLLIHHLRDLRHGQSIEIPLYDFSTHTRKIKTKTIESKKVIIVEGILILVDLELRQLLDIKVFVDTDADTRFIRRLQRDISERGRTVHSVIRQYKNTVKPMHMEFVEPSKRYADLIIPEGGYNQVAVDMLITKILSIIQQS